MILWRKKKFLFSTHRFGISLYNNTLVQSTYISKSFSGKKNSVDNKPAECGSQQCWTFLLPADFWRACGTDLKNSCNLSRFDNDDDAVVYCYMTYVRTFKFLGWDDWYIMTTYESIVFGAAASEGRVFTSEKKTWFFLGFSIKSWKDEILYMTCKNCVW